MAFGPTERLDTLLSSNPTATSAEARALLTRISSEIKKRSELGSISSFEYFSKTAQVLGKIKGTAHASLRLGSLAECANFFQVFGYPCNTLSAARHVEDLANSTNAKHWQRKGYLLIGMTQAEIGDVGGALVSYEKSLVLAREESKIVTAVSLVNIGTVLNYCSLHREAIPCFQRADLIFRAEPNAPNAMSAMAMGNLAQSFLWLEEYERGYEVIRNSIIDSAEPSDFRGAYSRTVREWTYVHLALGLGKIDEARIHAVECMKYGRWGENPRGMILASTARGLCEVFGGNVERGLETLKSALSRASDESGREDALRALVKAYDELRLDDQALSYLRDLCSLLRARWERGILTLLSPQSSWSSQVVLEGASPNLAPLELREAKLRARLAERKAAASQMETLERFAVTADLREEASGEHGYRVGKLSALLGECVGLNADACVAIEIAARLHDIGKIGIPDRILHTGETLEDAERTIMSSHTLIGGELLAKSQLPQLRLAEEIARYHHEWWDGTGYPSKLKGKRIPLHARLVSIADVFDALTHGRPYAPAWKIEDALEEIRSRRSTQFDPDLTDRFMELISILCLKHPDLDEYLGMAGRNSPFAKARQRIRAMLSDGGESIRGPS